MSEAHAPYNPQQGKPPLDVGWASAVEHETRRRIHLSIATYAYEVADSPIMSDWLWDQLAQSIEPHQGTCHPLLDEFFVEHFSPMTGMWIHKHPELGKVRESFDRFGGHMRNFYQSK